MDAALPPYTPSEPSPIYSCQPSRGENTLEYTPSQRRATPTGNYTRRSGKFTITLYEQEDGVDFPVYHRRSQIIGSLLVEYPNNVIQVTIKIEGKLDTKTSESGSKSIQLISTSHTLWRKGEQSEGLSGYLPFSQLLPSCFTYKGAQYPLPPTYQIDQASTSASYIRVLYSINVCITRTRRNMDFLTKSDNIEIPFKYHPRVRAHRPILQSPHFFSTVKTSPDEWFQVVSAIETRKSMPDLGLIHCHLFVPSARVYGLTDRIPFHIQLDGPLGALRQLLMPQSINTPPHPNLIQKFHERCTPHIKPTIKVFLLRQSKVETRGYKSWTDKTIGEAKIWELPPLICESRGTAHLDWAGELQADKDVEVGGFIAGIASVRDFIMLVLEPSTINNQASPYLCLRMSIPIRLVSDSYAEIAEEPPPM